MKRDLFMMVTRKEKVQRFDVVGEASEKFPIQCINMLGEWKVVLQQYQPEKQTLSPQSSHPLQESTKASSGRGWQEAILVNFLLLSDEGMKPGSEELATVNTDSSINSAGDRRA